MFTTLNTTTFVAVTWPHFLTNYSSYNKYFQQYINEEAVLITRFLHNVEDAPVIGVDMWVSHLQLWDRSLLM